MADQMRVLFIAKGIIMHPSAFFGKNVAYKIIIIYKMFLSAKCFHMDIKAVIPKDAENLLTKYFEFLINFKFAAGN